MKVFDVMSTALLTATPDESLASVVRKIVMRNCGSVPVVDESNHLLGVIAIRDVMLPLFPNMGEYVHDSVHTRDFEEMEEDYPKVLKKLASEVMTANPMTVSADMPVLKAASYMGLKHLRRIPVTDEENLLIGMVSIGDVNRGLFIATAQ
ncbi:MAG: CBS domain-containing protein [Mariprofundales bacterium]|nr:CBS domain-containing protein [Mariprofundales bacterium]